MIGYLFQEVASVGEFHISNVLILHSLILIRKIGSKISLQNTAEKSEQLCLMDMLILYGDLYFCLVIFVFSILSERWGKNHMDVLIYF